MTHLIELVDKIIVTEGSIAALEHGRVNHSDHESCAIIAEEIEEHRAEVSCVVECFEEFWSLVRNDGCDQAKLQSLKGLSDKAMLAACEIIQVAAMARKAMLTIQERKEVK